MLCTIPAIVFASNVSAGMIGGECVCACMQVCMCVRMYVPTCVFVLRVFAIVLTGMLVR